MVATNRLLILIDESGFGKNGFEILVTHERKPDYKTVKVLGASQIEPASKSKVQVN